MSSFTVEVASFIAKVKQREHEAIAAIVTDLHRRIDRRSPVGDPSYWVRPAPPGYVPGTFRANWQLGVDAVPSGVISVPDATGETARARVAATIPEEAFGHVYYLVNNVPYAYRLEFEGWSPQAPSPGDIVAVSVSEVNNIVADAVAKAKAAHP